MLFLGNLTYAPNLLAARELAEEILPRVVASVPEATVRLVGRHDDRLADLHDRPGIELAGPVPDVAPEYAAADVAVLPIRVGSGTRIKALEAFAHHRPVVATPAALAGLTATAGEHYAGGQTVDDLATAASRLLRDPVAGRRLAAGAAALVERKYTPTAVGPIVRDAVLGPYRPSKEPTEG
jgi:glycosyltransferase involved in cell wall biosynthesis